MWVFDYGRPLRGQGHVSSAIRLRAPADHACGFGYGRMALFSRHGHLLQAFVKRGPNATRHTLALVLGVLESVRVETA